MLKASALLLTFTVLAGRLAGAATVPNGEIREFFNGARGMAMGGAAIAVVNDETAMLSNPAALGKLRDAYGTIFDPEFDLTATSLNAIAKGGLSDPFNPVKVASFLDKNRDSYLHSRAQLFPSIVVRNFGFGVFARNSLDAYMDPTGANMYTHYNSDYAILLGYSLRLWDGRIKFGVTGKAISRVEIDKTLDTTLPMDVGSNASEGAGLGADAGLMLTAPYAWLPTLTAVVRDIGGTKFEAGSGLRGISTSSRPKPLTQDIDVGLALFPIHSNHSRSAFTIEAQKITEAQASADKNRYLHVGYELNLYDTLFIRVGYNQRFVTGGLEFATERTQFQITSYGEDVGPVGTPIEDRRLITKFSFRF